MTTPRGTLELATDWVSKNELGVRVSAAGENLHAGKIDRFDPGSLDQFIQGVTKGCHDRHLDGVNSEGQAVRERLERILTDGPKARRTAANQGNGGGNQGPDPRPRIQFLPQNLHKATRKTDEIMSALNPPAVFQRGPVIVRIVNQKVIINERGVRKPGKDEDPGEGEELGHRQIISVVKEAVLKSKLSAHVVYQKRTSGEGWADGSVPKDLVQAYAQDVEWKLPVLEGITNVPILRSDDTVHATPGYDLVSGYFLTDACQFDIPERPTWLDARQALDELKLELFSDFPFAKLHHKTAALAMLFQRAVQPTFRPLLNEVIPGYLIRSPTRASGKGLIAKVISMVVDGQLPFLTTPPPASDKAEWRKLLTTIALEGHPMVIWDNVESGTNFGSPVLDAAQTAGKVSDRILGVSKSGSVPMNCTHVVTGNNIGLRGDAPRRFLPIDLNPGVERPDLRQGWRHEDLFAWARDHRARMISLVFTVLRAHALAGRPGVPPPEAYEEIKRRWLELDHEPEPSAWKPPEERPPRLGSFERWDDLVRAALLWLGEADPCAGMQDVIDTSDEDTQHRAELLDALHGVFGKTEFLSKDAWAAAEKGKDDAPRPDPSNPTGTKMSPEASLYHTLRGDDPRPLTVKKVGRRIQAITDAICHGKVLRRIQERAHQVLWQIQASGQEGGQSEIPF